MLTPLGNSQSTVENLLAGKSAVEKKALFDLTIPFASFDNKEYRHFNTAISSIAKKLDTNNCNADNTVIIYAAAKGDLSGLEESFNPNNPDTSLTSPLLDKQAERAAEIFGIKDAHIIVSSNACASGQIALEIAKELLEAHNYKKAIVFGFDALYKFTVSGFNSLGALSKTNGARPFDSERDGLTMGECAGAVLLEYREPKTDDIIILGAGSSNDANHRTGPSRTGDGLFAAMKSSIKDASIDTAQISAVKCHGTSTNYNDAMEAKALYSLFNDKCPPASSLKGALGHMSGGGSLVEVLIGASLLLNKMLPPTIGFASLGVEESIAISNKCQPISGNTLLCLAAGFGGLNSSLILEKAV